MVVVPGSHRHLADGCRLALALALAANSSRVATDLAAVIAGAAINKTSCAKDILGVR